MRVGECTGLPSFSMRDLHNNSSYLLKQSRWKFKSYLRTIAIKCLLASVMIGCASFSLAETEKTANDYDSAILEQTKVIEQNPFDSSAFYNRGTAKYNKGDYDGALFDFTYAIKLKADNPDFYTFRGIIKFDKSDYDGAVSDFTKAIELKLDDSETFAHRGIAKYKKGDYDGAISDNTKAIELKPDHSTAFNNRGLAKSDKGDYDGAISDYTKAIELKPDSTAFNNRGSAKFDKGDYGGAVSDYTKAIELKPDDPDAYNNRGFAYEKKQQFENAIRDYRKALEIDQNNVTFSDNLKNIISILNGNTDFTEKMQIMLSKLKYYSGPIDGIFGPVTRKAINSFQMDNNLQTTGEIDNPTLMALEQMDKTLEPAQPVSASAKNEFRINFPADNYETDQALIPLDVIFSSQAKIDRIVIKVNDENQKDITTPDYNSTRTEANLDGKLPLHDGVNTIKLVAFTEKGTFTQKVTVISKQAKKSERIGEKWAVVIGVQDYTDKKISDLNYAVTDAEDFANLLMEKGNFPAEHIFLLTDHNLKDLKGVRRGTATDYNIRKILFTTLRNNARKDDTVVVYYSGHGILVPDPTSQNGKSAYLAPQNFEFDAPEVAGIKLEDVKRLAFLSPERIFLILDSCFSGGGNGKAKTITSFSMKAGTEDILSGFAGKGRVLFSSSRENQVSLESDTFKKSVFTHFLTEAMADGKRRLSEINEYVYKNVSNFTNGAQQPKLDLIDQAGEIFLY